MSVRTRATSAGGGADTRGFTIVVAALNSLDPTLAPAAYRCDGVADNVEINAALVVVNAIGGGTVCLLESRYTLALTINGQSSCSLRGNGYGTELFVANNTFINAVTFNAKTFWVLSDLRINGNQANNPDQASDLNQNCLYLLGGIANNGLVQNCWLVSARRNAIRYDADSDCISVVACYFTDNRGQITSGNHAQTVYLGNRLDNVWGGFGGLGKCIIVGNNFNSINWGIWLMYGRTVCAGNYCEACNDYFINANSAGNKIICNRVAWSNNCGIVLQGAERNSVIGNHIELVHDGHGILLINSSRNQILANTVYNSVGATTDGIHLETTCNCNLISLNIVDTSGRDGLRIDDNSDDNRVLSNILRNNTGYGVRIVNANCNRTVFDDKNYFSGNVAGILSDAATDTVYPYRDYPVTYASAGMAVLGDIPVAPCANGASAAVFFEIPKGISLLVKAYLIVIPTATQAAANWDLFSDYAAVGELYNNHSEQDIASTYNVVLNTNFEIELIGKGFFASALGGDRGGIRLLVSTAGHDVDVVGLRLEYI
jgi:hypothetical protein